MVCGYSYGLECHQVIELEFSTVEAVRDSKQFEMIACYVPVDVDLPWTDRREIVETRIGSLFVRLDQLKQDT